jgi:hypothetical protein
METSNFSHGNVIMKPLYLCDTPSPLLTFFLSSCFCCCLVNSLLSDTKWHSRIMLYTSSPSHAVIHFFIALIILWKHSSRKQDSGIAFLLYCRSLLPGCALWRQGHACVYTKQCVHTSITCRHMCVYLYLSQVISGIIQPSFLCLSMNSHFNSEESVSHHPLTNLFYECKCSIIRLFNLFLYGKQLY